MLEKIEIVLRYITLVTYALFSVYGCLVGISKELKRNNTIFWTIGIFNEIILIIWCSIFGLAYGDLNQNMSIDVWIYPIMFLLTLVLFDTMYNSIARENNELNNK